MSNFICYKCNTEMEEKKTQIKAGWGKYKLIIDGVKGYVCPKCGEVIYAPDEVKMIQEIGRGLSERSERPELLNVSETADLLRVTTQTIYNMIRSGRLKAYKCGREWRFNKKDLISLTGDINIGIAARSDGSALSEHDLRIISDELEKM